MTGGRNRLPEVPEGGAVVWPTGGAFTRPQVAEGHPAAYTEGMGDEQRTWHPGEIVPESGIYECDCGAGHHWSTDVKGHRFPPLPAGCPGGAWALKTDAHPDT